MDSQLVLVAGAGLAIVVVASVFARRTGVATPLLLVALGIAASYTPGTPVIELDPEIVLAGVLPPLLYASAIQLRVLDLRRNLKLIVWLSFAVTVLSALAIGALVHLLFPTISFGLGVALGAVVSPTDAVAATSIGRRVGLPPRIMTVLEGESLVNDAAALVVLRSALAAVAAGGGFELGPAVGEFAWAVVGAILVGGVIGWLSAVVRGRLDDPVLNSAISLAVPFLAYVPAEELNASGVLAVVVAGLVSGTAGARRYSARDRQTQNTIWATVSFILESGVFLAMGYQLPQFVDQAAAQTTLGEVAGLVALVTVALVVLRFLALVWPAAIERWVRPERTERFRGDLAAFEERLQGYDPQTEREENRLAGARRRLEQGAAQIEFEEREPLTSRGFLVIGWAAMRGVVTVAAVQTIPTGTAQRSTVVLAAFLVALITLVLFGLTLPSLIRRLDFPGVSEEERRDAFLSLMRRIGDTAIEELGPLEEQKVDGEKIDPGLVTMLKDRFLPRLLAGVNQAQAKPGVREQALVVQRRYVDTMRDALLDERSIGAYSSATYRQVELLLDRVEQQLGGVS